MAVATTTAIALEVDCSEACREFAAPLLAQLAGGRYDECSVLDLDLDLEEWSAAHRTARRRAARAAKLGYSFAPFERAHYADDVFAINTSLERRQGRPMSAGYLERPEFGVDLWACPRHNVTAYGVFADVVGLPLVAYAFVYRSGELALVSQILGHGEHLAGDVMYLLLRGVVEQESVLEGFLVYNRHDSGGDGLRYFKERNGLEPRGVSWVA